MPITAEERLELLKWVMTLDANSETYRKLVQIRGEFESRNEKQPS
ncbi:hypothetical protein SAMN05444144_1168 [Flavobacterium akiainvivens]|nr:hypothetical protein SAMN05444144_1168 [Flavobacterium akiainvivens]